MIRVHVVCEGQTEVTFTKALLIPHFSTIGIYLFPSLIGTPGHKGGNVKFDRLFTDARKRLHGDTESYCTTFFDFYALPTDFPGKEDAAMKTSISDKADCINSGITQKLEAELGSSTMRRFIPYVQMHEFEALLFSDPEKLALSINKLPLASRFHEIRDEYSSPEEINDSPDTAPSKRIERLVSGYDKPVYGTLAAQEIGLNTIRSQCKIFDSWLKKLEALEIKTG